MRHIATVLLAAVQLLGVGLGRAGGAGLAAPTGQGIPFALTSPAMTDGGELPMQYTCDGASVSPPLEWSGAPAGTQSFALLMDHVPGPGDVHWYWVLYDIPVETRSLPTNASGVGKQGTNSVDGKTVYAPPCSKGPGLKIYTLTLFALSASPSLTVPPTSVTREVLLAAIADRTLGSAALNVGYSRTGVGGAPDAPVPPSGASGTSVGSGTPGTAGAGSASTGQSLALANAATTAAPACQERIAAFKPVNEQVSAWCDAAALYVESTAVAEHQLMVGIRSWNQHVPMAQAYSGTNAWRIPLNPVAATSPSATNGQDAIGLAINGVPFFDPTRQDGVYAPDSDPNLIGELDECAGHSGRAEDYHYHAAPVCLVRALPRAEGAVLGFALDGYRIVSFREASGAEPVGLDKCNGHEHDGLGYHYHATAGYPYVMGCYHGKVDVSMQPKTHPIREPGQPVAATIVGFERPGTADGWTKLSYEYAGVAGSTSYRKVDASCYEFQYVNPPPGSPGAGAASQQACVQSAPNAGQPAQQGQPGQSGQPGQPGQQPPQGTPPQGQQPPQGQAPAGQPPSQGQPPGSGGGLHPTAVPPPATPTPR